MGEKVVFDTNVWVAILLRKTLAGELVSLIEGGRVTVHTSRPLLRELAKVLTYTKIAELLSSAGVAHEAALASVVKASKLVNPRRSVHVVKDDPADDKIIECALASKASFIVSGDRHLLALGSYGGIKIVEPRKFLNLIAS